MAVRCAGGALTSSPEESGEESEYRLESSDAVVASCAFFWACIKKNVSAVEEAAEARL